MLMSALNRTWSQLFHPTFRKVFFIGIVTSFLTLIALSYTAYILWPTGVITGWSWLDEYLYEWGVGNWALIVMAGPAMLFVSYILFPPIAAAAMSFMSDDIIDAVEEEYYPHNTAPRKANITETVISFLKLTLVILFVNLLALIPYLILFFLSAGFGTLALYLLLNGYLIGREYMEMVAMRHMPPTHIKAFRLRHHNKFISGGILIVAMFLVPFLNIAAPIIGTAVMTHLVQSALRQDQFGHA